MSKSLSHRFVPLEDYFALDSEGSRERWEWRNGDIYCMSGAQPEHNVICLNIAAELRAALRNKPCQTYPSDQRVKVHAGSPYLYPDVSVACEPRFATINGLRTLLNPILIVEVMSPSTAADDRGTKFMQYQTLETLTDYLLVDSASIVVLHYRKRGDLWEPELLGDLDAEVDLPDLDVRLPIAEIYLDSGLLPRVEYFV